MRHKVEATGLLTRRKKTPKKHCEIQEECIHWEREGKLGEIPYELTKQFLLMVLKCCRTIKRT